MTKNQSIQLSAYLNVYCLLRMVALYGERERKIMLSCASQEDENVLLH